MIPYRGVQSGGRTRHIERRSKRHAGNTTSISASRPSVPFRRATEKAHISDMIHYEAYDQRVPGAPNPDAPHRPKHLQARKTNAQNWVTLRPRVANQNQQPPVARHAFSAWQFEKLVALPEILPGLHLANKAYMEGLTREECQLRGFRWAINMSQARMPRKVFGELLQVSDVPIPDNRFIGAAEFFRSMSSVLGLVRQWEELRAECPEGEIKPNYLIYCNAGTNRSCSAAIYIALTLQRLDLTQAVQYIEQEKERAMSGLLLRMKNNAKQVAKGSPKSKSSYFQEFPQRIHWDSMTNHHYINLLQLHLTQLRQQQDIM